MTHDRCYDLFLPNYFGSNWAIKDSEFCQVLWQLQNVSETSFLLVDLITSNIWRIYFLKKILLCICLV